MADGLFYDPQICPFESPVLTNDVIMTSLQKQWQNSDLCENQSSNGHLCQILACFAMPTHQTGSCQVTQVANFEFFLFLPDIKDVRS